MGEESEGKRVLLLHMGDIVAELWLGPETPGCGQQWPSDPSSDWLTLVLAFVYWTPRPDPAPCEHSQASHCLFQHTVLDTLEHHSLSITSLG